MYTPIVAAVLVLVASTLICAFFSVKIAFEIATLSAARSTVSTVLLVTPPIAAETVTAVSAATGCKTIEKFTEVAPAGTVTLAGTPASTGFPLTNDTLAAESAGPLSATVPVTLKMPYWRPGFTVNPLSE